MPIFNETPICISRANCFHCRNNEQFRNQMKSQYGDWECPEKIPINAPIEQLPPKAQEAYRAMMEMQEKRNKQIEEVKVAINELEMVVPPHVRHLVDKIRSFVVPDTKTTDKCKDGGPKIGEVDQECCGGKINKVDAFKCAKHTVTTARKCMGCEDFTSK